MKTTYSTCFGPKLPDGDIWCNVHLHVVTPGEPNKHDIIEDTQHPMYGTLATLQYPSDSYPFVVIGGSASGKTLYFAPILTRTDGNVTRMSLGYRLAAGEFALDNYNPEMARTYRRSRYNSKVYGERMFIGSARRHLAII